MGFSTQVKYRLAQNITEVLGPQNFFFFFLAPKLWAATNVCSSYFLLVILTFSSSSDHWNKEGKTSPVEHQGHLWASFSWMIILKLYHINDHINRKKRPYVLGSKSDSKLLCLLFVLSWSSYLKEISNAFLNTFPQNKCSEIWPNRKIWW